MSPADQAGPESVTADRRATLAPRDRLRDLVEKVDQVDFAIPVGIDGDNHEFPRRDFLNAIDEQPDRLAAVLEFAQPAKPVLNVPPEVVFPLVRIIEGNAVLPEFGPFGPFGEFDGESGESFGIVPHFRNASTIATTPTRPTAIRIGV